MGKKMQMWQSFALSSDLQGSIEALRPILEECDREAVAQRSYPLRGIHAMMQAGLFRLPLAREVGGLDCDALIETEAYEQVARISVAASWNLVTTAVHTSWASAYLSDEAVRHIFTDEERSIVAGQRAPMGTGRRVDGGYRVSGHYSWGSGISHAAWVLGGFRVEGEDELRVLVTPKSSVKVLDNWHVFGIEGSGSFDFTIEDVFVPDGYWFSFTNLKALRGGARFRAPIAVQVSAPHASIALGGCEHALEVIATLAATKRRVAQQQRLADRGAFQRDVGEAFMRIKAARAAIAELCTRLDRRNGQVDAYTPMEIHEYTATGAYACAVAADVVNLAFRYGGGNSVRLDNALQRTLRDVLVAQQHVAVADTSFDELGRCIIDLQT